MRFEEGKEYRVLKDGARLSWQVAMGPSCWQGADKKLAVDDVITYTGAKMGWGSDNIPLENFTDGKAAGEFWPNNWGRVEDGWLEPVEEHACL